MPTIRPFRADDYPVYAAWFADPELDRFLRPIGTDWLDALLSETDGTTLALLDGPWLVAVVGVYHADPAEPGSRHHLSDLAVDPSRRREGLGRQATRALADWPLPGSDGFSALVHRDNAAMRSLLTSLGWRPVAPDAGPAGMDEWHSPRDDPSEDHAVMTR